MAIDFNSGLKNIKESNRVSSEDIQLVKSYVNIIDILNYYNLSIESETDDFFIKCIWHEERTASLCIRPEHNFFHCFGCGVSGDIIDFIERKENLNFKDTIKLLKDKFCVDKIGNKVLSILNPVIKEKQESQKYIRHWLKHLMLLWDIFNETIIELTRDNGLICDKVIESLVLSASDNYYSVYREFKDSRNVELIFNWYRYIFGVILKEINMFINAMTLKIEDFA